MRRSGTYNIGGGGRITINELTSKIIEITGSESRIVHTAPKKEDVEHTWVNIEKAKKELGCHPRVTIKKG